PQASVSSGGFASPYLLASGLLSPKLNGSSSPKVAQSSSNVSTPQASNGGRDDYFGSTEGLGSSKGTLNRHNSKDRDSITTPGSSSFKGIDGKKRSTTEKLMAYTSDGSFVIKSKKK
ncbi:hypothetical protein OXX79_010889, partial [Metschnikowia pulcherrima]